MSQVLAGRREEVLVFAEPSSLRRLAGPGGEDPLRRHGKGALDAERAVGDAAVGHGVLSLVGVDRGAATAVTVAGPRPSRSTIRLRVGSASACSSRSTSSGWLGTRLTISSRRPIVKR